MQSCWRSLSSWNIVKVKIAPMMQELGPLDDRGSGGYYLTRSQGGVIIHAMQRKPEQRRSPAMKDPRLAKMQAHTAVVAVVGLVGYVGLPLAMACAEQGFPVVGINVAGCKVETRNQSKPNVQGAGDCWSSKNP